VTGLLTTLSVLAAWALLGVLLVGLLLMIKSLQSIRAWLQKVTVGLRAVEHQTQRLGDRDAVLGSSMQETVAALDAASRRLVELDRTRG
jgi:uncharacterized protein YoxC